MTMREPTVQSGSVHGRRWYAVAALALFAGIAGFVTFLTWQLSNLGGDFVRVTVPGQTELTLEGGTHTIFQERRATSDGVILAEGNIVGLRVSVQRPGGGAAIPLTADSSSRYSIGSRSGQSVFTFAIVEPGTYRFAASYDDGRTAPQTTLLIGRGFMSNLLKTIFGAIGIAFGGVALAAAIAIYVYRRRQNALDPSPTRA